LEAVVHAFEEKIIPLERLEKSLQRIQATKSLYVETKKPVDVTEVGNYIGLPEHFQLADLIARKELPAAEAVAPGGF